jgi:hypothetical protein
LEIIAAGSKSTSDRSSRFLLSFGWMDPWCKKDSAKNGSSVAAHHNADCYIAAKPEDDDGQVA